MAPPVPGDDGYLAGPSFGAPVGYGTRPLFQPTTWALLLTSGAKKLVTTFIVLGVVVCLAYIALMGLAVSKAGSTSNAVVASNAIAALNTSYGTLNSQLTAWQNATKACDQNLPCVTSQDATAATLLVLRERARGQPAARERGVGSHTPQHGRDDAGAGLHCAEQDHHRQPVSVNLHQHWARPDLDHSRDGLLVARQGTRQLLALETF